MASFVNFLACLCLVVCVTSGQMGEDICRTTKHTCKPMTETCFKNDQAPKGYLCCMFNKNYNRYIYKNGSDVIHCDPLKCIVCDSNQHSKCGETFEYSSDEVKSLGLQKDCAASGTTNPRACRKMVIYRSDETVVLRSCWNTTNPKMHYYPNECSEMEGVTSCYCTKDGCNGQGALAGSVLAVLTTAILALWGKNIYRM